MEAMLGDWHKATIGSICGGVPVPASIEQAELGTCPYMAPERNVLSCISLPNHKTQ